MLSTLSEAVLEHEQFEETVYLPPVVEMLKKLCPSMSYSGGRSFSIRYAEKAEPEERVYLGPQEVKNPIASYGASEEIN